MPKITPEAARRLAKVMRRVENQPPNSVPQRTANDRWPSFVYVAVTEEITARSGSTFGMGKGEIQEVYYEESGTGKYRTSHIEVPIYSGANEPIAEFRLIQCKPFGGRLHVDVDYC